MLTFLEICENIKDYEVGTKFEKYEFVNGEYIPKGQYLIINEIDLFNSNNKLYKGRDLTWRSGNTLTFNEEMLNFKFKRVEEYVEIQPWEAIMILKEEPSIEVFGEYCGEKQLVEVCDDFNIDWDIETFGDLVNRTRFYKLK